ncbi:SapC family protein [Methylomicrobium agile]|uniref:SapC family protein n=1 Tax=Methylomicrobium agile TaxID=39774 RepID=UPI000689FD68|nr:SapC family protein [Methylomicrobium agile]
MSNYQALSFKHHVNKRWLRPANYAFAAADTVAVLSLNELPHTLAAMPIGFIKQDERFLPAAIQSLHSGRNWFVGPDQRWLGDYIPAVYRAYPFRLAKTEEDKRILLIDADSGLIAEGVAGEAFFTAEGQPTPFIQSIVDFLSLLEQDRQRTVDVCEALQSYDLIQPWPITVKVLDRNIPFKGLYKINETALNALSGEALRELMQVGALSAAYCQLFSVRNLTLLGRLVQVHGKAGDAAQEIEKTVAQEESDTDFFSKDGIVSFKGLF